MKYLKKKEVNVASRGVYPGGQRGSTSALFHVAKLLLREAFQFMQMHRWERREHTNRTKHSHESTMDRWMY